MASANFEVAIIGAGLSGLALALALHQQSIKCSIYEARDAPTNIGGALMLMANGLKVLDKLGVYSRIQKRGYNFDRIYIQDAESKRIIETAEMGNAQRYGYQALRIYRHVALEECLAAVKEKGIPIHFNKRFSHVVSESADEVEWQFQDGEIAIASLLIGADGIYSTVRSYLAPNVKPKFSKMAAIVAAIPTSQLELPPPVDGDLKSASNIWPLPSGVIVPRLGAFVIAPQTYSGDKVMITVQRPLEEASSWKEFDSNKEHLRSLLRQNSELYPEHIQKAVRDIPSEQLRIWPFYHIPRLERWTSAQRPGGFGRVIIVGDSAHALPPSGGQGVNQAFEDVYLIALILGRLFDGSSPSTAKLEKALFEWQNQRQKRVDRVLELNKQMDLRRMPKSADGGEEEMEELGVMYEWLFSLDFKAAVDECMRSIAGDL